MSGQKWTCLYNGVKINLKTKTEKWFILTMLTILKTGWKIFLSVQKANKEFWLFFEYWIKKKKNMKSWFIFIVSQSNRFYSYLFFLFALLFFCYELVKNSKHVDFLAKHLLEFLGLWLMQKSHLNSVSIATWLEQMRAKPNGQNGKITAFVLLSVLNFAFTFLRIRMIWNNFIYHFETILKKEKFSDWMPKEGFLEG